MSGVSKQVEDRLAAAERKLMAWIMVRKNECFDKLDLEGEEKIEGEERNAILKQKKEYEKKILDSRELKLFLRSRKTMKAISLLVLNERESETFPCLLDTIFGFMDNFSGQCNFESKSWVDGCAVSNINEFMYFIFGDSFSRRGVEGYHGMYRLLSQGLHSLFAVEAKFGGHVRFAMPDATVFDSDRPVNYNVRVGGNKCMIISALYGFLFGSGYDDREIRHFMSSRYFTLNFIVAFACIITQVNWTTVTPHPIRYFRLQ